jgi:hypothetical protein
MPFESPDTPLSELLKSAESGKIQLPDFQRKWKWDNDRIRGLLSSISLGHPVGVVMLLEVGAELNFAIELISGVPKSAAKKPERLLLDGQQRLTSLYQSLLSVEPVKTQDSRKKRLEYFYYIDMRMALDQSANREDAIVGVPSNRITREDFGRTIVNDYSTTTKECQSRMFPINLVFDSTRTTQWLVEFMRAGNDPASQVEFFSQFQIGVLENFTKYLVPTIVLSKDTSRDAVCTVFEKVNTGGVALNVFELLTATFAMSGFRLKDDWDERHARLKKRPVLATFDSVDFLQAVSLLTTLKRKQNHSGEESEIPGVSCKKVDVLKIKLSDYQDWAELITLALLDCADFLHGLSIFTSKDLPYRTQLIPLAAIRVLIGDLMPYAVNKKIRQWYWCGVLGELYGGANETRFARDIEQVPKWVNGGSQPGTVEDAIFGDRRLITLRTRNSAAYKGIFALLMQSGGLDWLENVAPSASNFINLRLDLHHIYPKKWCQENAIDRVRRESIVNKTALSKRTNIRLGGKSPKIYLAQIRRESELSETDLADMMEKHYIDVSTLVDSDFEIFFESRLTKLSILVSNAMGKQVLKNRSEDDPELFADEEFEDSDIESMEYS